REAPWPAGLPVGHDLHLLHLTAVLLEEGTQLVLFALVWEVAHVQSLSHSNSPNLRRAGRFRYGAFYGGFPSMRELSPSRRAMPGFRGCMPGLKQDVRDGGFVPCCRSGGSARCGGWPASPAERARHWMTIGWRA